MTLNIAEGIPRQRVFSSYSLQHYSRFKPFDLLVPSFSIFSSISNLLYKNWWWPIAYPKHTIICSSLKPSSVVEPEILKILVSVSCRPTVGITFSYPFIFRRTLLTLSSFWLWYFKEHHILYVGSPKPLTIIWSCLAYCTISPRSPMEQESLCVRIWSEQHRIAKNITEFTIITHSCIIN